MQKKIYILLRDIMTVMLNMNKTFLVKFNDLSFWKLLLLQTFKISHELKTGYRLVIKNEHFNKSSKS